MKPFLLTTKLALWKKTTEDEEFVEKAIDSLYKKLKTKTGKQILKFVTYIQKNQT
jgi:hypothetical protein